MRGMRLFIMISTCGVLMLAQSNRGTITGTISDPAGAVVASGSVESRNAETGVTYSAASSETGNYTIAELPPGTYELTITVPGFKKFVRPGLVVQSAQTIRVDAMLDVGNTTESVTVSAEAPLLKTESGELSQTIATERMDNLPLLVLGSSSSGIRNPYNVVALLPGSYYTPPVPGGVGTTVRINGGVTASETLLVEGMDATNGLGQGANQQNQPGMDQIQEWTVQTSNYSAEFGQAGSAVMNVTMKSGTNQFHGSVYEYLQNEDLNAGQPFTNSGNGHLIRPKIRRNDYGLTLGGPVSIPKVYDGHNRTFFFFSWEQFLQNQSMLPAAITVPSLNYRNGDFSQAVAAAGNRNIGTDLLGRPILANEIYDPTSRQIVNGQVVTDPFPNNKIDPTRFDHTAVKIQNLMPMPLCVAGPPCNAAGVVSNYQNTYLSKRDTEAPSLKLDQSLGARNKLSFFWNRTVTACPFCAGAEGLPEPLSFAIGTFIHAHSERLNYDHTVSPTLLLHMGIGYSSNDLGQPPIVPQYDACGQLGLCGPFTSPATFPQINFLNNATAGGLLGNTAGNPSTGQLGAGSSSDSLFEQGNAIASLTWVKNNHSFKFGGEFRNQGSLSENRSTLNGVYNFTDAETGLPYLVQPGFSSQTPNPCPGTAAPSCNIAAIGANHVGLSYASFLLGAVDAINVHPPSNAKFGKHQLGLYVQDSWKVTRKLTLDIGLRYDYSIYYTEQHGRSPNFAPNLANPTAGGHPGAVIYQATCHCDFAKNYPWGFGPRFGIAYQFAPKTVLRGGFGVVYSGTGVAQTFGGASGSASATDPFGPNSTPGLPIMTLSQVVPLTAAQIAWPNFNPGFYPVGGVIPGSAPQYYDQNAGRPARQYQWSVGIQREIAPNLVVEASFVGNRGIWWPSYGGTSTLAALSNYDYLTSAILSQNGLSLNNPADVATLLAPLSSPAAGRFQNRVPFAGFPLSQTVAQSLRPFPQFVGTGPSPVAAPLGDSWYDSLQITANKRFSHGLEFTFGFTWSKALDTFGGTPDLQNLSLAKQLSQNDQPFVTRIGFNYTLPKLGPKGVSQVVQGWMLNGFLYYASGIPFAAPTANAAGYPSNLTTATIGNLTFQPGVNRQVRVPGQPLFLQDPNCHCFDPSTTFVLNPAAWTNPGPGQFGGANYYGDFRGERRPIENLAIGRQFRIKERASLNVRAEFNNIFNRTYLNNPSLTSPQTAPVCKLPSGSNGSCSQPGLLIVSGFGSISTSSVMYPQRFGQLVAQFRF